MTDDGTPIRDDASSGPARAGSDEGPIVFDGKGVSEGIAIAPAICLVGNSHDLFRFPLDQGDVENEIERLHEAIAATERELGRTQMRVGKELGTELAGVFDAHRLILGDRSFVEPIVDTIRRDQVNAEWAVQKVSDALGEKFAQIENELLRERGEDLRDVTRYLLRVLQGIAHHELGEIEEPVIIVADEITPSEAVRLGRNQVVGFAIQGGGQTSHTTIMARALKIPLVIGLSGITRKVADRDPIVLDGNQGRVILHPTAEIVEEYRTRSSAFAERELELVADGEQESVTLDGTSLTLRANIELPDELDDAVRFGARGIGLYRSEFLYIEKSPELPTEEEQIELMRTLVRSVAPHPVIVRTYDLGGRKFAQELFVTEEENPSLGLRGIRLTLARPEVFKVQIRSLMRAATEGDLRVMIPLVSNLGEIRRFKEACREVSQELAREGYDYRDDFPIGTMIEVPAAALIADRIVQEVDFVSIGTNDLIQYALAVDRSNEHVANLYEPLHPAVVQMILRVVQAADSAGIEVSVCGETAGDTQLTGLLLALGVRILSMAPRSVPRVVRRVRELDLSQLEGVAQRCAGMGTAEEVQAYLEHLGLF